MKTNTPQGVGEILEALAEIRDMGPDQARSMPPACYTSEDFLELEKEEILSAAWFVEFRQRLPWLLHVD